MKLIVNPAAGAGRAGREWPQVQRLLSTIDIRYEHALTEQRGHAIELARDAAPRDVYSHERSRSRSSSSSPKSKPMSGS